MALEEARGESICDRDRPDNGDRGRDAAQTVVLRFTDVCVERDGRWIVIASHATRIHDTP